MVENLDSNHVRVINAKGQRKIISSADFEKINSKDQDIPNEFRGYKYDVNWYLCHGWKEARQMFNDIENG